MSDALAPIRDPRVTLNDLIEVILERGVVLHLDLVIAVADIPLIGLNVRAALAGIETMLSYGLMREWDESMRAWVQRSLTRDVGLPEGESLSQCVMASVRSERRGTWRPGMLYLTSERVIVARRHPRETLLDLARSDVANAVLARGDAIGGDAQDVLRIETSAGATIELLSTQIARVAEALGATRDGSHAPPSPVTEVDLWYREARSGSSVWRRGRASIDDVSLAWRGTLDRAVSVRLALSGARALGETGQASFGPTITLEDEHGAPHHFGGPELERMLAAILRAREGAAS